jgi:hypothetical protein
VAESHQIAFGANSKTLIEEACIVAAPLAGSKICR